MTTYSINAIDSDAAPAWLRLCETATPGPQDSGRCRWVVTTAQVSALEAAMEDDGDVLEYEEIDG